MVWAEVDLEQALWTVPAERMKAGVEHQVPLGERARAILQTLHSRRVKSDAFVFQSSAGKRLSNMSMAMLLRRMGRLNITVHGFRSTFRDWAGETTSFPREVIEMALAHTVASKTERAYRRGRSVAKQRQLMDAWEAFLQR